MQSVGLLCYINRSIQWICQWCFICNNYLCSYIALVNISTSLTKCFSNMNYIYIYIIHMREQKVTRLQDWPPSCQTNVNAFLMLRVQNKSIPCTTIECRQCRLASLSHKAHILHSHTYSGSLETLPGTKRLLFYRLVMCLSFTAPTCLLLLPFSPINSSSFWDSDKTLKSVFPVSSLKRSWWAEQSVPEDSSKLDTDLLRNNAEWDTVSMFSGGVSGLLPLDMVPSGMSRLAGFVRGGRPALRFVCTCLCKGGVNGFGLVRTGTEMRFSSSDDGSLV